MQTSSLKYNINELDYYVSCLCSNPMPDRYTEMKVLKQLIDEGKVALLQAVVERVAATSRTDKRSPVFKKLMEKFGGVISDQPVIATQTEDHVERNKYSPGSSSPILEQISSNKTAIRSSKFLKGSHSSSADEKQESSLGHQSVLPCSTDASASSPTTVTRTKKSDEDVFDNVDVDPLKYSFDIRSKLTTDPFDCSTTEKSSGSGQLRSSVPPSKGQAKSNEELSGIKTHRKLTEKWIVKKWFVNPYFSPNENIYKCEHCAKRFDKSESLDMHKRRVHRIVKSSLKIFDKHRHRKGTKFACEQCGRKYNNKRSHDIHVSRTHNARSKVPCPENCGKMLTKTHGIKKHLLSHRPESEWPIGCPLCSKRFQGRTDLAAHILSKKHSQDILPEVGSDQWWALVYWDRPQEAPRKQ